MPHAERILLFYVTYIIIFWNSFLGSEFLIRRRKFVRKWFILHCLTIERIKDNTLIYLALSLRIFVITRVRLLSPRPPVRLVEEGTIIGKNLGKLSTSEYIWKQKTYSRDVFFLDPVYFFVLFRWSWYARVTTVNSMINNYYWLMRESINHN